MDLTDNTVILFTSDHGCHFKTRNDEYKRSCHESSIRVPTALSGGPFTGGGRVTKLVSLIDLPPTLLDVAGIAVPPAMQGRSILPLLKRSNGRPPRTQWPQDVLVQISESQVGRALRTERWKYGINAPDKDGWKDASSLRYVEQYLYDLAADPYELDNLVGRKSHQAIADTLRRQLLRRMVQAGEALPVIEPAAVRG